MHEVVRDLEASHVAIECEGLALGCVAVEYLVSVNEQIAQGLFRVRSVNGDAHRVLAPDLMDAVGFQLHVVAPTLHTDA